MLTGLEVIAQVQLRVVGLVEGQQKAAVILPGLGKTAVQIVFALMLNALVEQLPDTAGPMPAAPGDLVVVGLETASSGSEEITPTMVFLPPLTTCTRNERLIWSPRASKSPAQLRRPRT